MKKFITLRICMEVPSKGMTLPQIQDFTRTALRVAKEALPPGSIMKTADFTDLTVSVVKTEVDYSK